MTNWPKVFIIILNWNGLTDTLDCLVSLQQLDYPNFDILVVDNGSVDGSQNEIVKQYPHLTLIRNEVNLGFAAGNNVGIRYALQHGVDYLFLLNNDTAVAPDCLKALVLAGEQDKSIGMIGAVNYYYDKPNTVQSSGAVVNWLTGIRSGVPLPPPGSVEHNRAIDVDYVPGSSLLVKVEVINKVGFLAPVYFCYFEETDWCVRAKRANFKIVLVPKAKILHKVSRSSNSPVRRYLSARNEALFLYRNSPKKYLPLSLSRYFISVVLKIAYICLAEGPRHIYPVWLGFIDFIRGKWGQGSLSLLIAK